MTARVAVNAAPLIFLAKARQLSVLRKLFATVSATTAVLDEIRQPIVQGLAPREITEILEARRIDVNELDEEEKRRAKRLSQELNIDVGEAEVAVLYEREGFDAMIVADEVAERKLRRRGINVRDITDIGLLAEYERVCTLKDFIRGILEAGYRTRRVRKLLSR